MKIKTSTKILLIAGALPILSIIIILSVLKFSLHEKVSPDKSLSGSSDLITRMLPLEGFSEIYTKGAWSVNVIKGENFLVNISGPESDVNEIKVEKHGNELALDSSVTRSRRAEGSKSLTAEITLPELTRISAMDGVTSLKLSSLDINSLSIQSFGVANISSDKGAIGDLEFNNQGVLNIDLSTTPVNNAHVVCNGVFNIELLMSGGRLSGELNGAGTLQYHGDISANDIQANSPLTKVVHKND